MEGKYIDILSLKKSHFLLILVCVSLLLLLTVSSKIFFTPIGFESIGRMFHYYVNYDDFGFIKRGLWGTLLSRTGVTSLMDNKYVEYMIIYLTISMLFIVSFWSYFHKKTPSELTTYDYYLSFIILFSPALFLHLGYSLGNFDNLLMLIFIMNILVLEKSWIVSASIISSIAILVHEIYLIAFLPLLSWMVLEKYNMKTVFKFLTLPAMSVLSLYLWGRVTISHDSYLLKLKAISADLLQRDGFYELTSSISENINVGLTSLANSGNWTLFPIAMVYIILILLFLFQYIDNGKMKHRFLGYFACFMPLSLALVGNDVYRWMSITVLNLFLFMLINRKQDVLVTKRVNLIVLVLLLFVFLGPMGNVFNGRPFPIIQTILNID